MGNKPEWSDHTADQELARLRSEVGRLKAEKIRLLTALMPFANIGNYAVEQNYRMGTLDKYEVYWANLETAMLAYNELKET